MYPPSQNISPEVSDKVQTQQNPLIGRGLPHIHRDALLAGNKRAETGTET